MLVEAGDPFPALPTNCPAKAEAISVSRSRLRPFSTPRKTQPSTKKPGQMGGRKIDVSISSFEDLDPGLSRVMRWPPRHCNAGECGWHSGSIELSPLSS